MSYFPMTLLHELISITEGKWIPLALILSIVAASYTFHIIQQLYLANPHEPPVVFHWIPFLGSTVAYGIDPYKFFFDCREKHGDIFTFILLGRKTTVYLGTKGNDFILNGKLKDVNAGEVYGPLTIPVFGKDVVYDIPHAKFMEQKKFIKYGLTTSALQSYVSLMTQETERFFSSSRNTFSSRSGVVDLHSTMAELTVYTVSASLQGREVRERFDHTIAELYHDLDNGFRPINFMLPWAPLPQNRKRDAAQKKMADIYKAIIETRRKSECRPEDEKGMIWNLMKSTYKDGTHLSNQEISHIMITLLMAGQHSSSATISWILLRLASRPDIQEELLLEQQQVLGTDDKKINKLTYENLSCLPLHNQVVRETLRLHAPIHSILRKVKSPMSVEELKQGRTFVIPTTHNLLAAPGVTSRLPEYFPEPMLWEPHRWDESPRKEHAHLSPSLHDVASDEKEDYGYGLVSKGTASPYLPFGAGRHRCIGEQFAYVQLQTILVCMVRDFKFANLDGSGDVIGTDYTSLFSRPLSPAVVKWERR